MSNDPVCFYTMPQNFFKLLTCLTTITEKKICNIKLEIADCVLYLKKINFFFL